MMDVGPIDYDALADSGYSRDAQHTYIIEAVGTEFVKIGRTADISKRIATLQTSCPHELRLYAFLAGDCEAELHRRFEFYRVRGEWFTKPPRLDLYISILDRVPRVGDR